MNNFDDDLRKAAHMDDTDLANAGNEGLIRQVTATFRSRMRYWVALVWVVTLAMTGLAVYSAVSFFQAESMRSMIAFATLFLWAMIATGMLKMWYWMEMNRNTHTREIKRVELQMARLAERLEQR